MQLNKKLAFCHSGSCAGVVRNRSGIFLIFSPHSFVLKKDSRQGQAGMTDYEEKHEVMLLKQQSTFNNFLTGLRIRISGDDLSFFRRTGPVKRKSA